jgi:hypothetical protein
LIAQEVVNPTTIRPIAGQWVSPDTLFSSSNKTDHHDITEILLKVAFNTITLSPL